MNSRIRYCIEYKYKKSEKSKVVWIDKIYTNSKESVKKQIDYIRNIYDVLQVLIYEETIITKTIDYNEL